MKLIKEEKFNKLYAEEGYHIRASNDNYIPAHIDENGEHIDEYIPNYFTEAYVPKSVTNENLEFMYIEEKIL